MKVYIVRHGESETNLNRLWTGWADVHLTDKGKKQAQKVGEFLKGIKFEKIYTSDLIRTMETAENVIPGCSYEISGLIKEFNVGELTQKPYAVTTDEQWAKIEKEGFAAFRGESNADLENRVLVFMKELEKESCENIAVFTHGGWIRTFLDTVTGVHIPRKSVSCENIMVAVFEYKNNLWKLRSWINID